MGGVTTRHFIRTDQHDTVQSLNQISENFSKNGVRKINGRYDEWLANIPYVELTNDVNIDINNDTLGIDFDSWSNIYQAISNNGLRTVSNTGLTVNEKCAVDVSCNLYFESSIANVGIAIELTVNGISKGIRSANGYISSSASHTASTTSLTQHLELNSGDKIGIRCYRTGDIGLVTAVAGKSNLLIKLVR